MKKLLLIAFIIVINKAYAQCPTEAVVLVSQSDVDSFATNHPTCDVLSFDLSIGKTDFTSSDITDLSPLSNLTSIGGFLYVHDNPGVTNLNGLSNLTSTGDIYIDNNTELTSLSALSGISKTSGYLEVFNNSKLTNLTGLTGVSNLTTGLYVGFNPLLSNFVGLDNLTGVGGYLWIENNDTLDNMEGLEMLNVVDGFVYIDNNGDLDDYTGLSGLTTITASFSSVNNDDLDNFTGLAELTTINGYLEVDNNSDLLNFTGLIKLNSIADFIWVRNNGKLTSLNGLDTVVSLVGGSQQIQIDDNVLLTDISGIENINSANISRVAIRRNSSLTTCEILNVCSYLDAPPEVAFISGNATGCASVAEVQAACATLSTKDFSLENTLSIFPNPTNDILNIHALNSVNIENIEIFSLQGRLVKKGHLKNKSLNINDLASGMYLLKVTTDKGVITEKIIKE